MDDFRPVTTFFVGKRPRITGTGQLSSPSVVTDRIVTGILEGASTRRQKFEITLDSGEEIDGDFVDAMSEEQRAELPQRYSAILRTTTAFTPATEKQEVSYFLVRLLRRLEI